MIAVASPTFSKNKTLRHEATQVFGPEIRFNESGKPLEDLDLIGFLRGAHYAIIGLEQITTEVLERTDIKVISKYGVGLDNIDFDACRSRGVTVRASEGVNARAVAEHTIGLMLALLRKIHINASRLRHYGMWTKDGGTSLFGKTVGIIGVGHVGFEVKTLLEPFGVNLLLNDIVGTHWNSKEQIYEESDIITVHVPLNKDTKYMISMYEFCQMKRRPVIINTSRGAVIKQSAIKEALRTGFLSGAALDVFEDEPTGDQDLYTRENVICTPHTAGASQEAVLAMGRAAIGNLKEMICAQ